MSCPSNQNPVRLSVAMGSLPEGFCGSPQQLGDAIAARLIVTPDVNNATFVSGSVPPTSNVGPWFRNCEQWFKFDDATGTYIPVTKGGFDNEQFFTSSGSFIVPAFIYKIRASAWGGGGGGGSYDSAAGAGGGGGAFAEAIFNVTPAQVVNITIGVGGSPGAPGGNGGDTTILTMVAGGGKGGVNGGGGALNGLGGTATGGVRNFSGGPGGGVISANGGSGGNSPQGGQGGRFDFPGNRLTVINGAFPGGGAAGGGATGGEVAGSGAAGACLIEY